MNEQTLYTFLFSGSLREMYPVVISIHKTKKGAYKAMRKSKLEEYEMYMKSCRIKEHKRFMYDYKFGWDMAWEIGTIEVGE